MVKTTHWGYTVDSEVPTTGVFHATNIEFIFDEAIENGTSIDLNWEEHKLNCEEYKNNEECNCEIESDRYLLGFQVGAMGLFETNPKASFSAILNAERNTLQVIKSKWGIRCALCSPCYPGQGDGDTPGEFLAYAPDPELVGEIIPGLRDRIFLLEKEENEGGE